MAIVALPVNSTGKNSLSRTPAIGFARPVTASATQSSTPSSRSRVKPILLPSWDHVGP